MFKRPDITTSDAVAVRSVPTARREGRNVDGAAFTRVGKSEVCRKIERGGEVPILPAWAADDNPLKIRWNTLEAPR